MGNNEDLENKDTGLEGAEGAQEDAPEDDLDGLFGDNEGSAADPDSGDDGSVVPEYDLPEAYAGNERIITFARENKLTPEQLKKGIEFFDGFQAEVDAGYEEAVKQESAKLRKEWGGEYKNRLETARKAVKILDKESPGLVSFLRDTKAATHPQVVRVMEAVGRLLEKRSTGIKTPENKKDLKSNKPKKTNTKSGWDLPPGERLYPKKD